MNARQKRKARYAETHPAPEKTPWVKTSEWGEIVKHHYGDTRPLLRELRAYGLDSKHDGSQKPSKLKRRIAIGRKLMKEYQDIVEKTMSKFNEMQAEEESSLAQD